jgi:regulator of replication initiation timing
MTTNPEQRYKYHLNLGDYAPMKEDWLIDALKNNALPIMSIVDHTEDNQKARALEAHWILHFHLLGCDMLNKEVYDAKKYDTVDKMVARLKARSLKGNPPTFSNTKDQHMQALLSDNIQLRAENERLQAENTQLCKALQDYEALLSNLVSSLQTVKDIQKRNDNLLKAYTPELETA